LETIGEVFKVQLHFICFFESETRTASMKIVTDSAADMSQEEIHQLGIAVAPLHIQFPDCGLNSEEISADEFYRRLAAISPNVPTTSQPSAGAFTALYKKLAGLKEEILSIHISSGLSGTLESARTGASHLVDTRIQLFDSLTLSGGLRFHVLAAAHGAKMGWKKEAIIKRLEAIRAETEVAFTLDTLSYLARGGRIGRLQALAGSLLKIKPVIRVDKTDGKYSTAGKARTLAQALESIRDHMVKRYGQETPLWISVMHGQFAEQAHILAEILSNRLTVAKLEIIRISPVLGVHTGPGVVGAAVVPVSLFDGLE
jgi:DegV family protein with EDD domain